jgi:hypothetical protein
MGYSFSVFRGIQVPDKAPEKTLSHLLIDGGETFWFIIAGLAFIIAFGVGVWNDSPAVGVLVGLVVAFLMVGCGLISARSHYWGVKVNADLARQGYEVKWTNTAQGQADLSAGGCDTIIRIMNVDGTFRALAEHNGKRVLLTPKNIERLCAA